VTFIVYGLPRSRTFWLSKFLSYRDWNCGHDEIRHARSMADVDAWFGQPCTGTVETAAAPWWRLAAKYNPRVVVVRRPVAEVVASAARAGGTPDERYIAYLDRKLDQIEARVPGVLSVQFADLASESTCAAVFEHCLPYRHDSAWWAYADKVNAQTNLPATVRYMTAYAPQLQKLAGVARHVSIAGMARPMRETAGLTIQQERFADWYRDAAPLFRDHMAVTGQAIDDYTRKNIPVLQAIDDLGFMQITTARCNGRMFGYLMAVISPSLDAPDTMDAMHLPFFASPEFPGLGMKLQRASISGLKARGADALFMRAGTRGSGHRLGALYRRLGAESAGEIFKLDLKAA
jgi:hypothetical protein